MIGKIPENIILHEDLSLEAERLLEQLERVQRAQVTIYTAKFQTHPNFPTVSTVHITHIDGISFTPEHVKEILHIVSTAAQSIDLKPENIALFDDEQPSCMFRLSENGQSLVTLYLKDAIADIRGGE